MERRIKLRSLNSHIACKICSGYLIDATTVTECLHTFCKSCLVKHLEETNTCPACDIVIHQSHPLQYISFDRTMQDIVYKLVPNLQDGEMKREREFYRQRGLPCPKDIAANSEDGDIKKPLEDVHSETGNNRFDEQVTLCLEASSPGVIRSLKKRYLRCPAQATVTHVKKFIARKVMPTMDAYKDVEVLCNDELLGKDHTLKFVLLTRWRFKDPPIRLTYRPRHDILS